jgi:hypothetical protein
MPLDAPSCRVALLASCLLAAPPVVAVERFVGTAYRGNDNAPVYREVHVVDTTRHTVLFECPDGKAFARKQLDVEGSPAEPDYSFVDARTGYEEGVEREGATRVAYVRRPGSQRIDRPLPEKSDAVIDAGFDMYLRKHWDAVIQGGVSVAFLITSRGRFMPIHISADDPKNGNRQLTLRLDAWYAFVAPSIVVTYSESDRRLRRYEGPSNIRDARGKPINVRVEFPPSERKDNVAGNPFDEAMRAPLDGRCAG